MFFRHMPKTVGMSVSQRDTLELSEEQALFRRMREEAVDSMDEELEMEYADLAAEDETDRTDQLPRIEDAKAYRWMYFRELHRLQLELVQMQDWIAATRHKLVIIFEGRDAAGKGSAIKRISQRLNPRICRVAALPAPTERERAQWYFQRYVTHLPAGGEIVLFDRSWYNRAGVELGILHRGGIGVFQHGARV
jgi:polyphosphate kinase 2 (PPK2 family)